VHTFNDSFVNQDSSPRAQLLSSMLSLLISVELRDPCLVCQQCGEGMCTGLCVCVPLCVCQSERGREREGSSEKDMYTVIFIQRETGERTEN
jgi:hypothetical protein